MSGVPYIKKVYQRQGRRIVEFAPVRHGEIIETIEDGKMKRVFSCCGTDFTQMTCWLIPKYCPECGAILDL